MKTTLEKLSLKLKLIIGCCIIALGGMAVTGVLTYRLSSRIVMKMAESEFEGQLKALEPLIQITYDENLERQKKASQRVFGDLSSRISVSDKTKVEIEGEDQVTHEKSKLQVSQVQVDGHVLTDHSLVDHISDQAGVAVTIFAVTDKGLLRQSTSVKKSDGSRAIGTYIPTSSPVYQEVMSGKPFYGRAKVLGQDFVTAYLPVVQGDGTKAVIFTGSPESAPALIKNYIAEQKVGKTGYFYVLDNKGILLVHPTKQGESLLELKDADGNYFIKDILEKKTGKVEYNWVKAPGAAPVRKMAVFRYFPTLDWYVAVSVDLDDLYQDVHSLRNVIMTVTMVVMFIMVIGVGFMSTKLVNLLVGIAGRLRQYAEVMAGEGGKISTLSDELSAGSSKQASALEETASALQEVSSTIQKNLESTQLSEELSLESKQAATRSQEVVDRLSEAIAGVQRANETAHADVNESYNRIRDVSMLVKGIEEKTKVINDIVFQTKLLAFNASVEAARAGEHGKGFSVVAEEMSNLAAMTGHAARDIDATIGGSVQQVEELIKVSAARIETTFSGSREAVEGCVTIAEEGRRVMGHVLENAVRAHAAMQEITVASNEQARAIGEISRAIHQIEEETRKNSGLSHESASVAQEIKSQADLLEDATNELQDMVLGTHKSKAHRAGQENENGGDHAERAAA